MLAGRSPSYATRSGDIFLKPLLFVFFPTVYTKLESVFFFVLPNYFHLLKTSI